MVQMPRQQIEHQQQCALIQWAEGKAKRYPNIGLLMAYPIEGKRNIITAVRLKKKGARRGIPDLFLPVQNSCCGGLFIEMKSPEGYLNSDQKWWRDRLLEQGYSHAVCHSWVEAAMTICQYLDIPHTELDHAA